MKQKRPWYTKLRYLFPLAFLGGGLAGFIEELVKEILRYT